MIEAVVLVTLLLAGLYTLCWLLRGDFRRQVEQPKYRFQQQLDVFESRLQRPLPDEDPVHDQQ